MLAQVDVRNRLLKSLSPSNFALLSPYLELLALERDHVLVEPDKRIEHVCFIESGMVSVVAERHDGRSIEVGVYGRDGMSGSAVLLDSDRTPHVHFMQIGGLGLRLDAEALLQIVEQNPTLKNRLLRFVHVFMIQTAQTALVNGSAIIEERLARWILMCHDRIDGDDFPITHEFLAMMLGVRRSSVTAAVHLLEGNKLIKAERGRIKVLDRGKLKFAAEGASYGVPEDEFRRLIGPL